MDNLTNREKIILVLRESIKFGKEVNFLYHNMDEKHKELLFIKRFDDTIDNKIKLFENLDDKSFAFQRILDTAKIACNKLKSDNQYNYYSAELIMKVSKLEEFFNKKLKSIGVRIIDQPEPVNNNTIINNEDKISYLEDDTPLTNNTKFIEKNITGKKFISNIIKQKEITNIIKNSDL